MPLVRQGQEDGQSPWRGKGRKMGRAPGEGAARPIASCPSSGRCQTPLRGLWSQNRVSKTTKNLKMAAQLNQELSPTELGVCAVAQEAGLRGAAWGWPGAGQAGKRRQEGPRA